MQLMGNVLNSITENKTKCCGCGACEKICPVQAVQLVLAEGFLYPRIDERKCTMCGTCRKVCSYIDTSTNHNKREGVSFVYQSDKVEARKSSSSGAFFYDIACAIIDEGGYVCGCIMDEKLEVYHIVSNKVQDVRKMQGSKYVQSDIRDVFDPIFDLLKEKNKVLFSGTPCQCVSVTRYVRERGVGVDNLICVGVICHGVPSPDAWKRYIAWMEKEHGKNLVSVNFRDKTLKGYVETHVKYTFLDRNTHEEEYVYKTTFKEDLFMRSFLYHLTIRNSCYQCQCKWDCVDVLIGDWHQDCHNDGEWGTSCVVGFTKNGMEVMNCLSGLIELDIDSLKKKNHLAVNSAKRFAVNHSFMDDIEDKDDIYQKLDDYMPVRYKVRHCLEKTGLYRTAKTVKDLFGII